MNLKNHTWLMVLGCLIPVAAITAVTVFQIPLDTVVLFGLVLLCPAVHLFMMRGMGHSHGGGDNAFDEPARPSAARQATEHGHH